MIQLFINFERLIKKSKSQLILKGTHKIQIWRIKSTILDR